MAESDKENKPRVVEGGLKKHVGFKSKGFKGLIVLLIVVTIVTGVLIYKTSRLSKTTQSTKTATPTVTVEGVKYKALFKIDKPVRETGSDVVPTNEQMISELEQKITSNQATSQDYLNLAQLYVTTGNKTKAIENYQKAVQTTDHTTSEYPSFAANTQKTIDKLQASGN